jgi:hypothetical protein
MIAAANWHATSCSSCYCTCRSTNAIKPACNAARCTSQSGRFAIVSSMMGWFVTASWFSDPNSIITDASDAELLCTAPTTRQQQCCLQWHMSVILVVRLWKGAGPGHELQLVEAVLPAASFASDAVPAAAGIALQRTVRCHCCSLALSQL